MLKDRATNINNESFLRCTIAKGDQIMNPIALGLIVLGIVLLLFGIFFLVKSKKAKGTAFSIAGIVIIAFPFAASYLVTR